MKRYLRRWYKLTAPTEALRFALIVHEPRCEQGPDWKPTPSWAEALRYAWFATLASRAHGREQAAREAAMKWSRRAGEAAREVYKHED